MSPTTMISKFVRCIKLSNYVQLLLALLCLVVCFMQADSQVDGWKMTDRFYGFRYESNNDNSLEEIQRFADNLACFGWIQKTNGKVVGEARCSKRNGPIFQSWLHGKLNELSVQVIIRLLQS